MFCVYEAGNRHGNSIPPRGADVGGVGCPWTAHLLCFWAVKTVPVCMKWTINVHNVHVIDLSLLIKEINRLMLDVLT